MPRDFDLFMRGLRPRLENLVVALREAGYQFSDSRQILPGPPADIEATISRVEDIVGPLPAALASFYRIVGSVDLRGAHPGWRGCDYPDPLIVEPVSSTLAEAEEYAELENPKEEYWASETGVFRAPVAPDSIHKASDSGGMWYGVEVPDSGKDPVVLEEPHALPFTEYLEMALSWGGFPGLAATPGHTWPLDSLREAAMSHPANG